jgi:hypothetical protein
MDGPIENAKMEMLKNAIREWRVAKCKEMNKCKLLCDLGGAFD